MFSGRAGQSLLALLMLFGPTPAPAQRSAEERASWNQPIKPFRIIGNVYYVGVSGVSSFLITTPKGSVLIDGGFEETAPLIARNIAELGFDVRQVRYLLNSHAHYDHSGGLAELKRLSGARMLASKADGRILNSGSPDSPPVNVDRVVGDGDTVELGGVKLTARITPGHTPGCTTWTTTAPHNGRPHNVVFYCSTTVAGNQLVDKPTYPGIVADYERSFTLLRKLPCDVFLAPHGSFFRRDEKLAQMNAGKPDAFVDPGEMQAYVEQSEREFREELARQRLLASQR